MHRISILPLELVGPFSLKAQTLPKGHSLLKCGISDFSFPSKEKAPNHAIQVANGHYDSQKSFGKNKANTFP